MDCCGSRRGPDQILTMREGTLPNLHTAFELLNRLFPQLDVTSLFSLTGGGWYVDFIRNLANRAATSGVHCTRRCVFLGIRFRPIANLLLLFKPRLRQINKHTTGQGKSPQVVPGSTPQARAEDAKAKIRGENPLDPLKPLNFILGHAKSIPLSSYHPELTQ